MVLALHLHLRRMEVANELIDVRNVQTEPDYTTIIMELSQRQASNLITLTILKNEERIPLLKNLR